MSDSVQKLYMISAAGPSLDGQTSDQPVPERMDADDNSLSICRRKGMVDRMM